MTEHLGYSTTEDRTMPAVVYGLYLLAFATGLTALVGVILAHVQSSTAGPTMRSHYDFQIRTFWYAVVACVLNGILFGVGTILSFILIGIPIVVLSSLLFVGIGLWYALRCVLGIVYLSRGEAYPRPYALIA